MIKKKQHYVSRYYLKAWTNNKEQIFCLRENKIFPSSLMGVAQERFFYELQNLTNDEIMLVKKLAIEPSPKGMQESHISFLNQYLSTFNFEKMNNGNKKELNETINMMKKNFEEDYHAHIEGIGNKYLNLIRDSNIEFFYNENSEDRMIFLFFITLQYMRTKKRRNSIITEFKDDNINMRRVWPILAHIFSTNMALSLHINKEYKLVLLKNQTDVSFITGDQPLVNTYGVNNNKQLDENELEFYYPVSPRLGLLITRNITKIKELIITDSKKIEDYNLMINNSKEEQLFAEKQEELKKYREPEQMNLFEQQVPDNKLHPNYNSLIENTPKEDRDILNRWTEGFPDRDNKFIKEFQTTFNSSFWEIYLYKLFKDLGFNFHWDFNRPDFLLESNGIKFVIEATISSNAKDEKEEWKKEKLEKLYDDYLEKMNERNMYSIIRLANSFLSKLNKYKNFDPKKNKNPYNTLAHVKNKPFILAIAPFEQPLHYHQYDRPIMALLYDFYLDEEEYLKNPDKFPHGLQDKRLNYVEKENGNEIELGMFMDDRASEVSAVLFNPLATFAKVQNMREDKIGFFGHMWITNENKKVMTQDEQEFIEDGLFIFHNPFAKYPLDKSIFKRDRICQVYMDKETLVIEREVGTKHLTSHFTVAINVLKDK